MKSNTQPTPAQQERVESFARELALILRRLVDGERNENSTQPDNLPIPATQPQQSTTGDTNEH
jgi:hypothetical protein